MHFIFLTALIAIVMHGKNWICKICFAENTVKCVHVRAHSFSLTEWSTFKWRDKGEEGSPRIEGPEYHVMEPTYAQILELVMETRMLDFRVHLCVSGHQQNNHSCKSKFNCSAEVRNEEICSLPLHDAQFFEGGISNSSCASFLIYF